MNMNVFFKSIAVLIVLSVGCAFAEEPKEPTKLKLSHDTPVLKLNGRPVGMIYYERMLDDVNRQLNANSSHVGASNEEVRKRTLELLLEQELQYDIAMNAGVPDLEKMVGERFGNLIENIGGKEKMREMLNKENMNEENVKHIIRRDYAVNWYRENVLAKEVRQVTEKDALDYYQRMNQTYYSYSEKRKIFQILSAESRGEEQAKARLLEAKKKLDSGEGFGDIAKEYSDEPLSRLSDGFIGYKSANELPHDISQAVFAAKVGEVTEIVKSSFGWHLLLVTDIIPAQEKSFNEARHDVVQRLLGERIEKEMESRTKKYGSSVKVEVFLHM